MLYAMLYANLKLQGKGCCSSSNTFSPRAGSMAQNGCLILSRVRENYFLVAVTAAQRGRVEEGSSKVRLESFRGGGSSYGGEGGGVACSFSQSAMRAIARFAPSFCERAAPILPKPTASLQ